jgi:hypothetical protein
VNQIIKHSARDLGYTLSGHAYLPMSEEEKTLRDVLQWKPRNYRPLKSGEIDQLQHNGNFSPDWGNVLVHERFNPRLIRNSRFFGLVRIGMLENIILECEGMFHHVGIWDSTIISCDIGDNAAINSAGYIAHYILGDQVVIHHVGRIQTTRQAKFGHGILKQGEDESARSWIHVGNENGNRKILAFDGMLPADAWIWSRFRDDSALMEKLIELTDRRFNLQGGYYGTIGDQTVICNVHRIVDTAIGHHALIDGALRLQNTTISSCEECVTYVGEGCDLKDGVVGCGCTFDRGVKAERFVIGSHIELDLGARVRDVFIGDNASIHCCEIISTLTFPSHTQHHNNSFLIASTIQGLSNIAAGATIGSNHNSRAPDGELIAERGFWSGLNTSFKFPSRFAAYTLVANGVYPSELDVRLPFSLVSNSPDQSELRIMPAYWFMYNMYALKRNEWKYPLRDKRRNPVQPVEYSTLAPDTVESVFEAMSLLELWTGRALNIRDDLKLDPVDDNRLRTIGFQRLMQDPAGLAELPVYGDRVENSDRPVLILKTDESYHMYRDMIRHYAVRTLVNHMDSSGIGNVRDLIGHLGGERVRYWVNLGGQPVPEADVREIRRRITSGEIKRWCDVHDAYKVVWQAYPHQKARHALETLLILSDEESYSEDGDTLDTSSLDWEKWISQLSLASLTERRIVELVMGSRIKDHTHPFRSITFDSNEEGEAVLGSIDQNSFIHQIQEESAIFIDHIEKLRR